MGRVRTVEVEITEESEKIQVLDEFICNVCKDEQII